MLLDAGADVNGRDGQGDTPLLAATRLGVASICKFLLAWKHNSDDVERFSLAVDTESTSGTGETPLYLAIKAGLEEIALSLVKLGASPNKLVKIRLRRIPPTVPLVDEHALVCFDVVLVSE